MIPLTGRTTTHAWRPLATDVYGVTAVTGQAGRRSYAPAAVLLRDGEAAVDGADLYLTTDPGVVGPGPTLVLPVQLAHVTHGDVLVVSADGSRAQVAWKATARHNSILLTERCDHYCLMCSQPPKEADDSGLYGRAQRIISALPATASAVSLTGGEPSIDPERFLGLLEHITAIRPDLSLHVLSNGRRFADPLFAAAYREAAPSDSMVGIPLYAAEPALHDYIVQAPGAFNETLKGIVNLAAVGAGIEIRVVVQRANLPALSEVARFIARNLPFVDQVALMGLEMTGLAKPNAALVWADPAEYRDELRDAYVILRDAGVETRIYNHQLCVLDRALWPAAVQSISDWKNTYPESCDPCAVKSRCAGVFTTSGSRLSPSLHPILTGDVDEAPGQR